MKLRKVYTKDNALNRAQDNISSVLDFIQISPLVGGVGVLAASLNSGANTVGHGLGRKPIGWFVVGIDAPATLYNTDSPDSTFLFITSDIAANATIIAF